MWQGFKVASENNKYRVTVGKRVSRKNMADHDPLTEDEFSGLPFSTIDRDNDFDPDENRASYFQGGWWHYITPENCLNCQRRIWVDGVSRKPSESIMYIGEV